MKCHLHDGAPYNLLGLCKYIDLEYSVLCALSSDKWPSLDHS